jgi:predicted RNase H-like HicB family nuclease
MCHRGSLVAVIMYIYPVVFSPSEEGGYCVYAPDIKGCVTEAYDIADGIVKIRDGLCGMLYIMERDNLEIPEPTSMLSVEYDEGDFVTLIDVRLDGYWLKMEGANVNDLLAVN